MLITEFWAPFIQNIFVFSVLTVMPIFYAFCFVNFKYFSDLVNSALLFLMTDGFLVT